MSLNSPGQNNPSQDYTGVSFIGRVVFNNDPLKKERIQVTIENVLMMPPYTLETLPWVVPKARHTSVGVAFGEFSVPDVDSYVWVEFLDGNIQYPVYLGAVVRQREVAEALVNYPHRAGFKDRKGNLFYIDKQTNDVHFQHVSGTTLHISPNGAVAVTGVDNLTANVAGTMALNSQGAMTIHSDASIALTAPRIDWN